MNCESCGMELEPDEFRTIINHMAGVSQSVTLCETCHSEIVNRRLSRREIAEVRGERKLAERLGK